MLFEVISCRVGADYVRLISEEVAVFDDSVVKEVFGM